jgi:type III secretion protein Q
MVELPAGDASGEDSPIGELPIRLTFDFGRIDVPLDELEAIGPGHVFQFARPAGEPVDIMANGRRIGRGRIVEINGEAGVQVVWIGRHE